MLTQEDAEISNKHTESVAMCGIISFERNPKLAGQLLHIRQTRKSPHWNEWKGLRHNCLTYGPWWHDVPHWERLSSKLLPEEGLKPHLIAPQLLRPALERWAPTHLALKAKGARVQRIHEATVAWETVVSGLWGTHHVAPTLGRHVVMDVD